MASSASPEELIAAGQPAEALKRLQERVREKPQDAKLRTFLFQLLCVLGQWDRAQAQLELCGQLDHATLAMVNTYREALKCEVVREAVFAGKTTPMIFGQPQTWVASLVEALQADARGEADLATRLRADALEAAPASAGTLDGTAFDWIADADSRLGPVLEAVVNGRYVWIPFAALAKIDIEAPADLRDLVWAPVHLTLANGGDTVALLPTRYAGSAAAADATLQLSRKTEWLAIGADQYRGLGQRVLTTSEAELGLLEVREIALQAPAEA
ncbi:MAG TPA: type VI secretion system accessory protein TagJ [Caldimonas sp.]|nr:type VI secretion system accessory protein TagJ [Caldimonas sp.]